MKLRRARAIVLSTFDLKERDRIVGFLTTESGHKRGVAGSARGKFSRFHALQPLAEVDLTWSEKPGRDLVRIREATLIQAPTRSTWTLEQMMVSAYFTDSVSRFTVEDEDASLEYRLLRAAASALDENGDLDALARYFEVWLLRIAGILDLELRCPECGRDMRDSREAGAVLPDRADDLVCRSCAVDAGVEGLVFDPRTLAFVAACARCGPDSVPEATDATLRAVEQLTREIRRRFLHDKLRSYEVMRATVPRLPRGTPA